MSKKLETEVVETAAPVKPVKGTVANCERLNVRATPSKKGEVLTIINAGDKVKVDLEKSNEKWYSVRLKNGTEGFCMKEFIATP